MYLLHIHVHIFMFNLLLIHHMQSSTYIYLVKSSAFLTTVRSELIYDTDIYISGL